MARKPAKKATNEFVLFDVLYEDGSRLSNRRVPAAEAEEGDDAIRAFIEQQDREIGQMSGRPRDRVKSVTRSPNR
ncbi:MAG TPA: hypothetical protein VEB20_21360 [Azospirillaceae bacterium]|nr:hypothetical protein [Azospirillaceae bacterium]